MLNLTKDLLEYRNSGRLGVLTPLKCLNLLLRHLYGGLHSSTAISMGQCQFIRACADGASSMMQFHSAVRRLRSSYINDLEDTIRFFQHVGVSPGILYIGDIQNFLA